ncbi:MAG TPA: hypothetical protein EYP35_11590 [Desulfobacterales bacterium]|nr:hypothetical protein [Desulfobacterales bacterium]
MGKRAEDIQIGQGAEVKKKCLIQKRNKRIRVRKRFPLLKLFLTISVLSGFIILAAMSYFAQPAIGKYATLTALIDQSLTAKYHQLRSAAYTLKIGTDLEAASFLERLGELGYVRHSSQSVSVRQFFVDGDRFYLAIPGTENQNPQFTMLELDGPVVKNIIDLSSNEKIVSLTLPPFTLTSFVDRILEIRIPKTYAEFPPDLITAVLATEDQNYFHHPGIDTFGIVRAIYVNLMAGKVVQGGSTITQQLVKVMLKRRERSLEKKYEEALLALALEQRYTKEELLSVYLNNVYLGHTAPYEIRGMAAAAQYLLGKDLSELDLTECAFLGGLIRSPNSASPLRNPTAAAIRVKTVLGQMAKNGDSLAAEIEIGGTFSRIRHKNMFDQQVWFFDQLEKELRQKRILPAQAAKGQLIVNTTLDPWFQAKANTSLQHQLERLERKKKIKSGTLQGAVVILDPENGAVRALVGGRNYLKSPFNRAVNAKRQIGSLVKPFVYLAALGGAGVHGIINQATMIEDMPLTVDLGGSIWKPKNYDKRYRGPITARKALVQSRNIPAIKVGQMVGLDTVVQTIKDLGINDTPQKVPALFLGACESTPLRLAAAYGTIANGGRKVKPQFLFSVWLNGKNIISIDPGTPMLAPASCFVLTDMLQGVFENGTAASSRKMGFTQSAAGKTGTTSNLKDAWFAGYTPTLATVAWVGFDDNRSTRLTGASGALPVWVETMNGLVGFGDFGTFVPPAAVEYATIDPSDGQRAGIFTKQPVQMAFVRGTVPEKTVRSHAKEFLAVRDEIRAKEKQAKKKKRRKIKQSQAGKNWFVSQWDKTSDWLYGQ